MIFGIVYRNAYCTRECRSVNIDEYSVIAVCFDGPYEGIGDL